jgi:hypothetical protein
VGALVSSTRSIRANPLRNLRGIEVVELADAFHRGLGVREPGTGGECCGATERKRGIHGDRVFDRETASGIERRRIAGVDGR